ncbi:MAG: DUF4062 domain-containing protein [Cyanobacteria bacterium P01_A01_bin.84]
MVSFLKKRLQVFVSSTFLDLKQERQAAVSAILSAGHIPAGMELFTAGDQSQMEVIKQWIDESDVYLLILGSRYGSIEPETEKSYTHLEYEYAVSKNKPLFACVINNSAIEPRVKELGTDVLEMKHPQKLEEFRKLVLSKMSGFWTDTRDIELEIIKTLQTFSRREDLIGWVKGDEAVDSVALTDELARLSKENADLREENNQLRSNNNFSELGISYDEMKSLLEKTNINCSKIKDFFSNKLNWAISMEINNLFDFLIVFREFIDGPNGLTFKMTSNTIEFLDITESRSDESGSYLFYRVFIELSKKDIVDYKSNPTTGRTLGMYDHWHDFTLNKNGRKFLNWLDVQELK